MSFSRHINPLAIEDLKPGMFIIAIAAQNGPVKLRKSGLVKSQDMVNGLKEMGVLSLIIDWDNSIEVDDTPVATDPVAMNTRQLFNDEHKSNVHNAMSDQFNRSLFLPSLQALPSQFSVMGRYALQYIGVIGFGLLLGFGVAQLLPSPHEPVIAATADISVEPPAANRSETPLEAEVVPEVVAEVVPEFVEQVIADPVAEPVTEPEAEEQGILVTQEAELAPASAEMAARVNQALESLGGLDNLTAARNNTDNLTPSTSPDRATTVEVVDQVQGVAQLPEHILVQLPAMVFSAHMYSSTDEDRWVRVNNRRLQEGDRIDSNVNIVRIEPQYVVLSFRGYEFRMAALTDW